MAKLKPFKSLRPGVKYVKQIAALPYDVYSRDEAADIVKKNPLSFLSIDRPESTLGVIPSDIYVDAVYNRANLILTKWKKEGYLVHDETPSFYLYELTMGNHVQTGLVGLASVAEYDEGLIKKHEQILLEKGSDRINHIEATNAQTGPIFLAHRDSPPLRLFLLKQKEGEPLYDFTSEDGISHRVWQIKKVSDISFITEQLDHIESLYIADGHHRCAAAAEVARRRKASSSSLEEHEADSFLSVIFSENELQILPYHRIVKNIKGYSKASFLEALEINFQVTKKSAAPITEPGTFGMYFTGEWYQLKVLANTGEGIIENLDVHKLQTLLLSPLLGIEDPKTDSNLTFVGGIKTLKEIEAIVDSFPNGAAFTLYPTRIQDLFTIADNGEVMPPKSTWFEPKLRSGLFIHELD